MASQKLMRLFWSPRMLPRTPQTRPETLRPRLKRLQPTMPGAAWAFSGLKRWARRQAISGPAILAEDAWRAYQAGLRDEWRGVLNAAEAAIKQDEAVFQRLSLAMRALSMPTAPDDIGSRLVGLFEYKLQKPSPALVDLPSVQALAPEAIRKASRIVEAEARKTRTDPNAQVLVM